MSVNIMLSRTFMLIVGLLLIVTGVYAFYWIAMEIYTYATVGDFKQSIALFNELTDKQVFEITKTDKSGQVFQFSVNNGVVRFLYFVGLISILRIAPFLLSVLISTGSHLIMQSKGINK